jgi:hypothetical protein
MRVALTFRLRARTSRWLESEMKGNWVFYILAQRGRAVEPEFFLAAGLRRRPDRQQWRVPIFWTTEAALRSAR